jgi:DNA-binding MarR family transcriptional regulator
MIIRSNSAMGAAQGEAMTTDAQAVEGENRHIAGLLAFVEREAHVSQRALANELGVALGLVNTYIKRCVKKGLIKVQQVPSRRYAYYLTPSGFAEKSRLTAEYLSWSLSFFRRARSECSALFEEARERKLDRLVLFGGSDLTEIAILGAAEYGVTIVAIVDASMRKPSLFNIPVVASLAEAPVRPNGAIVTGIHDAQRLYDEAVAALGAQRVLVPSMLPVRTGEGRP